MQPGPYGRDDNYNVGGGSYDLPAPNSPLSPMMDFLKNNFKSLLLLIVIGVAAYYAYDYFVASMVDVTINVRDGDGELVPNLTGDIRTLNGDRVDKSSLSSNPKRITLRRGEYEIRVNADGYQVMNGNTITVKTTPDASKEFNVIMTKTTSVSFSKSNTFPEKIIEGQVLTIPIEFDNAGKDEVVELEATSSSSINGLSIELAPDNLIVPNGGAPASLIIAAASPLGVDSKGQTVTVTIKIKGTQKKQEFKLDVRKSPSFRLSPTDLTFKATAGVALQGQKITITNGDKTDYVFEPTMEIEVSESNNPADEVKEWFKVIDISPSNGTLRFTAPDNKSVITYEIRPPASAIADQISGVVKLSTDYWNATIPFRLTVTAAKNLIGLSMTPATFTIRRVNNAFENKNAILSLTNTTPFDISTISITLDDPTGCGSYIKFDETAVATLPKDSTSGQNKKDIQVTITAPASAKVGTVKACNILVTYDNPTNPGNQIDPPITKLVQITPMES